jgi:hypothetical protein
MKNLFYVFCVSFLKNQLANKIFAFLLFLFLLLPQYACNTTEPPSNQTLLLKLEDISCTEAWIQFSSTNIQTPNNITLYINDQPKKTINLTTADTLLYIDSLLPNQTYKILAAMQPYNNASNELSVTTMDTTTHNFTWQTWTFGGQAGSCALYDVAIIDENNIWAVGEIYMNDSLGQPDPNAYNAIHWDGQSWELKRIGGIGGWACHTVFAFSANDIWFEGNIHWDGSKYTVYKNGWPLMPNGDGWQVNKMWGSSSNDLYAVGSNGNIAHYQNGSWKKIESGTDLHIYDIWGDYNNSESNYEINLVAAQQFVGPERKILMIKNNSVEELSTSNISEGSLHGIWFESGRRYFVVGNGIYTKRTIDENNWDASLDNLTPYYTYAIRGSGLNNIFICGSYGELLHFNGVTWESFKDTPDFFDADFYNIDVKDEIAVAVGQRFSSGFITIGRSGF